MTDSDRFSLRDSVLRNELGRAATAVTVAAEKMRVAHERVGQARQEAEAADQAHRDAVHRLNAVECLLGMPRSFRRDVG